MQDVTSILARRSWPLFLLLGGALLLLVALYSPWQQSSGAVSAYWTLEPSSTGWSSEAGQAAGIFALLLAALAVAVLARPNLTQRLPFGRCALSAGYFGLATAMASRSDAQRQESGLKGLHFHYAYGTYLGVAGALVVLLAAGTLRRRELVRHRSASKLVLVGLVVVVLASFLLPWERYGSPGPVTFLGIAFPAAIVGAAIALWLSGTLERLILATALALRRAQLSLRLHFPAPTPTELGLDSAARARSSCSH
jgi:hypothetical protein